MNAAKKSERARLQHAVDCIDTILEMADDAGPGLTAHVLRDDPVELSTNEYAVRTAVMSFYAQMAEECAHMDRRVAEALEGEGIDVREVASRDRNLGAHEADRLDAGAVHGKIASGELAAMGRALSAELAALVERRSYFLPDQVEAEVAKKLGPDADRAAFEAAVAERLEAARDECEGLGRRW